ncbi:protein-L-isoaspartate O-methyltransferase family protein [Sphingomonas sp. TX0543]|uniref:protein-L-isoaspartate O-methyltransferase family protein n=1 Tax=unclassified Sphingomonas TaxID=196159 RepID=UPI0010F97131|nr:protein-L-isoaspartate O-methyltransferase [Sphingomonas sp. 3P27F8]
MMATTTLTNDFEAMRTAMVVSQLRPNAVNDPRVVTAMARVAREKFVPSEAAALAYRDTSVALGNGRSANLPIATGRLLTEARLLPGDRVLLIGAATGYTAAVLAGLVAHVVAVESDADLLARARAALADTAAVELVEGPLEQGYAAGAPYDAMIVDGAVEELPQSLIVQLREGGRVATGLIDRGITRLATGRRTGTGFGVADFADIETVVLPGFARRRGFSF